MAGIDVFNTIDITELNTTKEKLENSIEKLQSIGLPPITSTIKQLWAKTIEPNLLTKRQIIKKLIMISGKGVGMTEDRAQLMVYGKLYIRDGVLEDNDKKYPECVSSPKDLDYIPPLTEDSPIWKDVMEKINKAKKLIMQFGIKMGEFAFLVPHTLATIISSLAAMISSLIIFPIGSGIPTAIAAVQNIIASVKTLQAKIQEFLPILEILILIPLILPNKDKIKKIISRILSIAKVLASLITQLTKVAGLADILIKLIEKLLKRKKKRLKVRAKADPSRLDTGDDAVLSVTVTGGDFQYNYVWTDSKNTIIHKDPNDEDDGTRELTPKKTGNYEKYEKYTCKVTDGKGESKSASVKIYID